MFISLSHPFSSLISSSFTPSHSLNSCNFPLLILSPTFPPSLHSLLSRRLLFLDTDLTLSDTVGLGDQLSYSYALHHLFSRAPADMTSPHQVTRQSHRPYIFSVHIRRGRCKGKGEGGEYVWCKWQGTIKSRNQYD